MMYQKLDKERVLDIPLPTDSEIEEYRSVWRRDYARLVHSPSFRRLQGKTQLFPSTENDFFRNRLTHSIEVAQIAKSIAIRINNRHLKDKKKLQIDTDLVEVGALAHDLGHPPFGHQGEEALDECMIDCGGFEGNAQTLRILTKIEKRHFQNKYPTGFNDDRDKRVGLNLTYRTIASILKYDVCIPLRENAREVLHKKLKEEGKADEEKISPVKGYYYTEKKIVEDIKKNVTQGKKYKGKFKTIECKIMDIADDIVYSTYDLEDGFKAGFYTPLDLVYASPDVIERVRKKVSKTLDEDIESKKIVEVLNRVFMQIFKIPVKEGTKIKIADFEAFFKQWIGGIYKVSNNIASNGYYRTKLTSDLVGQYMRSIEFTLGKIPALSDVQLGYDARFQIEVLKRFTFEYQIKSPKLKIPEFRGKDIVKRIFEALDSPKGYELLPPDYREMFDSTVTHRKRLICDYIAGMTDKYLIEFYGRLTSESPETIFKPI